MARFLSLSALWTGTTLDTASFRSVQVVGRNPIFGVCLCTGCNGGSVSIWLFTSYIDLLDGGLGGLAFLLLWEVWYDPNIVEEVANADGTGKKEEVEEDAGLVLVMSHGQALE